MEPRVVNWESLYRFKNKINSWIDRMIPTFNRLELSEFYEEVLVKVFRELQDSLSYIRFKLLSFGIIEIVLYF